MLLQAEMLHSPRQLRRRKKKSVAFAFYLPSFGLCSSSALLCNFVSRNVDMIVFLNDFALIRRQNSNVRIMKKNNKVFVKSKVIQLDQLKQI